MKKGDKFFVRVDSKIEGSKLSLKDFDDHIEYLSRIASERDFIGGGFSNVPGGMIVFKARDLIEAKEIADNDPLMKRNLYRYEFFEWDIFILSEGNNKD